MQYHLEFEFETPIHIHLEKLKEIAKQGKLLSELLSVQEKAIAMLHTQFLHQSDASLCWHVWLNDQAEEPICMFFDKTNEGFNLHVTNPTKRKYVKVRVKDVNMVEFMAVLHELLDEVK